MEVLCWLWVYDKRWMFGYKTPDIQKIWTFPIIQNILLIGCLLYYQFKSQDACYEDFSNWMNIRFYLLSAVLLSIFWVLIEAQIAKNKDNRKMEKYQKANPKLAKRHNYWLRRKVLLSFPGYATLLLGLANSIWVMQGIQQVLVGYTTYTSTQCQDFDNYVLHGNIIFAGLVALPIIWVLFWMVFIKVACLLMGLICPQVLIWIKKKTHGI